MARPLRPRTSGGQLSSPGSVHRFREREMLTVQLLSAAKKPPIGTPGSDAVERGFDVVVRTTPNLGAFRVAVVWTPDGWHTANTTDCRLVETRVDGDTWAGSVSYFANPVITFLYALVAAGADGVVWDNNQGHDHTI
jgi:hypothetical protein